MELWPRMELVPLSVRELLRQVKEVVVQSGAYEHSRNVLLLV